LERLEKITVADVQNAAKKYFSPENARIVVAGKGSDILENLEQVTFKGKKIPVKYVDKTGAPSQKPDYNMAMQEGVSATSVLEKYLEAIGGREKLEGVASYALAANAEMQGIALQLELKKTDSDQFMQNINMMGNSVSKQVLDGDKGYMVMQGQRRDMAVEEIEKLKEEKVHQDAKMEEIFEETKGITEKLRRELEEKTQELAPVVQERSIFQAALDTAMTEVQLLEDSTTRAKEQVENAEKELGSIDSKQEQLRRKLANFEDELSASKKRIINAEKEDEELAETEKVLSKKYSDLTVRLIQIRCLFEYIE
jgi:chromosome segregation ATPase